LAAPQYQPITRKEANTRIFFNCSEFEFLSVQERAMLSESDEELEQ
jgi:hypothetical protein